MGSFVIQNIQTKLYISKENPMKSPEIPIESIEQIKRGNCVLFLGWVSTDREHGSTPKVLDEQTLAERLPSRVQFPKQTGPLYEVAEYFEVERGRQALIQYICDVIEESDDQLPSYYRKVVDLPFNIIVCTSLDNSLKKLLRENGKRFLSIIRDEEISFIDDDKLLVVKLYGDVDDRSSMVVSREDYINFFEQLPNISNLLKYYFSTKTLLFVGFDFNDPHFLQSLCSIRIHGQKGTSGVRLH